MYDVVKITLSLDLIGESLLMTNANKATVTEEREREREREREIEREREREVNNESPLPRCM